MTATLLLLVTTIGAGAQAPRLDLELTPTELTVGDRVSATLRLTVAAEPGAAGPVFPQWDESWGGAEIVSVQPPARREEADATVFEQRLELTAFRLGEIELPPVAVQLGAEPEAPELATEPQRLMVVSVIPAEQAEPEPRAAKPPRPLPVGEAFWWTLAALAALCLAGLWALLRRAAQDGEVDAGVRLEPIEALRAALAGLRSQTDAERLWADLSLSLRRYLGRRLDFHAAEGTTTEIHRELRGRRLPAEAVQPTVKLLREADRVKFARAAADLATARQRIELAESVARQIEDHLRPPPVEAEEPRLEGVA